MTTTSSAAHTIRGGEWLLAPSDPGAAFTPERLTDEHRMIGQTVTDFVNGEVLPVLERLNKSDALRAIVPVSATKGTNVDRLIGELWALLPAGPPLYGPDMLTDRSERFLAGELIREQLFLELRQEIPYAVAVVIEEWEERAQKGDVVIGATIIVEREGQRAIILGKKGAMIREIGTRARGAISDLLQRPAHLKLHIKVHPDWTTSAEALARYGYSP